MQEKLLLYFTSLTTIDMSLTFVQKGSVPSQAKLVDQIQQHYRFLFGKLLTPASKATGFRF